MNGSEPRLFISYRREDTAGHAGRLYDSVSGRFGDHNVFMDIELPPGIDFVERIRQAVGACHVLLVVVGPRWATLEAEGGTPRLAEPDDFVRLEVETALRRPDLTVIPVLVAGARMPEPEDLPEGIRPLARRNALEMSDLRWRFDIGRLIETLETHLADVTGVHPTVERPVDAPKETSGPSLPLLLLTGVIAAGLAGVIGRLVGQAIPTGEQSEVAAQIAGNVLRRAEIWAVVGVTVAVWITIVRGESRQLLSRALLGLLLGAIGGALGGVVFAVPKFAPDPALSDAVLELFAIAATGVQGALIGALLGALWIPRKVPMGLWVGLASGALIQLILSQTWDPASTAEAALSVGLQCVVIAGAVLGMLASSSERAEAPPPAVQRSPATG
jgi:TIR domain